MHMPKMQSKKLVHYLMLIHLKKYIVNTSYDFIIFAKKLMRIITEQEIISYSNWGTPVAVMQNEKYGTVPGKLALVGSRQWSQQSF